MHATLAPLVRHLDDPGLAALRVINWSCPIPAFGDPSEARVATLGLNPSNREFVDEDGVELAGSVRRFHTLRSLGLSRWADARSEHLHLVAEACRSYFVRNPYDSWFKRLDYLISGTAASYYGSRPAACHLDLVPFATACKWTDLRARDRAQLLRVSGNVLATTIRDSSIDVIVMNGRTVAECFAESMEVDFDMRVMPSWSLPRRDVDDVPGTAYVGRVRTLAGINLHRDLLVLGFNHNIQSSFGVTRSVISAIRRWITRSAGRRG